MSSNHVIVCAFPHRASLQLQQVNTKALQNSLPFEHRCHLPARARKPPHQHCLCRDELAYRWGFYKPEHDNGARVQQQSVEDFPWRKEVCHMHGVAEGLRRRFHNRP
jgi:hypothetical protein